MCQLQVVGEKTIYQNQSSRLCLTRSISEGSAVVYSFGHTQNNFFERDLMQNFGIHVHSFLTEDIVCAFHHPYSFSKHTTTTCAETINTTISLASIMHGLEHVRIDVLKLDVEGAEIPVLISLLRIHPVVQVSLVVQITDFS